MQIHRGHRTAVAVIVSLLCVLMLTGVSDAREVQLAGIRLGQHAVNLLDIYGEPMGIATGAGEAFAGGGAGAAGGEMGMGMGGEMGMGMEGGMMGGPAMGAGMEGGPAMGPGMEGGPAMGPGMEGGPAMGPGMEGGMMGEPAMGGGPGEFPAGGEMGGGGAAGGAAGGVQRNAYPMWALPVWVDLGSHEVQWLYRIRGVVIGFCLDRDGYINSIAIAGEDCEFARTSLWQPHQYVKLGDTYKRVIYRYGWPDETLTYYSQGPGEVSTGGGPVSVSFGGTTREFSRDAILRYTEHNNIEFTFHNLRCVRVHIWTHE